MLNTKPKRRNWRHRIAYAVLLACLVMLILSLAEPRFAPGTVSADQNNVSVRRVNVPYLGAGPPVELFTPSIFWFGQVTPTRNYADVRMWYYDGYLKLAVHIIDRRLWYDKPPSLATLTDSDAVTLYLDLDGTISNAPTSDSYKFVTQLHRREASEDYQAAYRGNGSSWVLSDVPFTTDRGWRGIPNNDEDGTGWDIDFIIPWSSLGLAGKPAQGTVWGLSVNVHDRDEEGGTPAIPDQIWPELANPDTPSTWGQMRFGIPGYNVPSAVPRGFVTVRHELDGATVVDGYAGGFPKCGSDLNKWTQWGEKNYDGATQIKVQNQWDVSDFPCFSKYFVTFPLDGVPPGKVIIGATLKMTLLGGSVNPNGETPDSYIQVLTVAEDWQENTLNWNNAPWAVENITGIWVKPIWLSPDPNYRWNVARAVAAAYQAGEPLRLALYSADGERHTGKYFWSSDSGVRSNPIRPTLEVVWGVPCDSPGVECSFTFLPAVNR